MNNCRPRDREERMVNLGKNGVNDHDVLLEWLLLDHEACRWADLTDDLTIVPLQYSLLTGKLMDPVLESQL